MLQGSGLGSKPCRKIMQLCPEYKEWQATQMAMIASQWEASVEAYFCSLTTALPA